jgi:hypothetical protein
VQIRARARSDAGLLMVVTGRCMPLGGIRGAPRCAGVRALRTAGLDPGPARCESTLRTARRTLAKSGSARSRRSQAAHPTLLLRNLRLTQSLTSMFRITQRYCML